MDVTVKSIMELKPFSIALGIWGVMAAFDLLGMSGLDATVFRLFGVITLVAVAVKERG